MHGGVPSHPLSRSMITWSITSPHFTSAKLLNASAWDDVEEFGELTSWTLRQWSSTTWLLNDTLKIELEVRKDATIAAIQSVLGYLVSNPSSCCRDSTLNHSFLGQ